MQTDASLAHCPQCGHQLSSDPRYITWCDRCDWNVDPNPAKRFPKPTWRLEQEQQLAGTLSRELERGAVHSPGWSPARASAFLLALPVLLFRPRIGHLPPGAQQVSRDSAPHLYDVLDRITTAAGTPRISAVAVTTEPIISIERIGWRHRRILQIGMSLWSGLDPQQRVAAIAHEVYDDRVALHVLNLAGRQRTEYLNDLKTAEIAGSEAAAGALERSLLADTTYRALERAIRFNTGIEPLEALRRSAATIPQHELDRRIRLSQLHNTRTDADHPPTHLRTTLVRQVHSNATVTLNAAESAVIDQELSAPAEAAVDELPRTQ